MTQVVEQAGSTVGAVPAVDWVVTPAERHLGRRRPNRFRSRDFAIRLDERSRLGRELHDSTAQYLVALQLSMGQLRQMLRDAAPTALFADLDSTIAKLHREIRLLALGSSMPVTDNGQFIDELQSMAQQFGRVANLAVTFDIKAAGPEPEVAAQIALYRVAQEALANASRHGQASSVHIAVRSGPCELKLTIEDDGIGLGPDHRPGCGLRNMRDRLEDVGGSLTIGAASLGGTLIQATVPLAG